LFPRFSNVIKEVQKNSKSKIPSKKKNIGNRIFRKDFDIEDLDFLLEFQKPINFSNQTIIPKTVISLR
jgi:hypothetical protein